MNTRVRIWLVAVMALVVLAMPVLADVGTVGMGVTNSIAPQAITTDNMGSAVKIDDNEHVGIVLKFQGDRAATDPIIAYFARSADNSTWETTPKFVVSAALNGNTAVVAYTNITALVGAAGWIKCTGITNAHGTATATNLSLTVVKKRVATK